jgi:hypothetical protein
MFIKFSFLIRLILVAGVTGAALSSPWSVAPVWAQDDDEDDEDDEDFDEEEDEEEEEEEGEEQPAVTAGGLFTKKTWPQAELERNLTVLGGMTEGRAGIGIDISNEKAFELWFLDVIGRYGIKDWSEVQIGVEALLTGELDEMALGTFNQVRLDAFYEHAMYFNLVNFRVGAEMPINTDAEEDPFKFDIAFGFPFRYKPKPQVAIIALDKLMTIHTIGGGKPDFTLGVGLIGQPAPPLAIILRAELVAAEFDFSDGLSVPATATVQFSPNNKLDLGLEFTFLNLNKEVVDAEDPMATERSPFDDRFVLLYGQFRI